MLTALTVGNAKARPKNYKLGDGRGLYLLVTPRGHRYWRFNYRFAGKQKTLALGVFPDVTLADARERRDAARRTVAAGRDPAAVAYATAEQERRNGTTFAEVADEWLARLELMRRAPTTIKKMRWMVDFARPALGERPLSEIKPLELLEVLRRIEARGRYETANRLRSTIGTIFRYGVATGRVERDISHDLKGALIPPKVTHRAAIVEPMQVGALLRAIEGYEGQPIVRQALRLIAHVFTRPGELRLAEWSEFNAHEAIWHIPGERTKMRRPHKVPLSRQAMDILEEIDALGETGKYVFPSVYSADRPISDNTMNAALRRLGYDKTQMTAHGFRATASTLLNESGKWHPDAIERQLAHVENNDVRRAYARGEHWDERVRMMQDWSDRLDALRLGGKVITGRFARNRV